MTNLRVVLDSVNLLHLFNRVKREVTMLGVRLDEQLEERLSALAKKTNRSKSYLAKEALLRYIEQEELKENEKQEALVRWERYQETGIVVSNDSIMEWLSSWGSDQEKPCPEK